MDFANRASLLVRMAKSTRQKYTKVPSLQPKLEAQISEIRTRLAGADLRAELDEVLLVGSCSRGEATYRSYVDLLVILRNGPLNYRRVCRLRDRFDHEVLVNSQRHCLPVEVQFVLSAARA